MQIPEIVTYYSTNNKPEWFSYLKPNGEFLGVRFEADTEAAVIERAKNWWINEKGRQNRLEGKVELDDDEVDSGPYKKAESQDGWGNYQPKANDAPVKSDHALTGKVWMGDPVTKVKKRVDPSEVAALMESGWVRAGPRTVI